MDLTRLSQSTACWGRIPILFIKCQHKGTRSAGALSIVKMSSSQPSSSEGDFFEGAEKLLELWFKGSDEDLDGDLRDIKR